MKCVSQPVHCGYSTKEDHKSVLRLSHARLHVCVCACVCMKERQGERAWQYDIFYLVWISVIFRPAGVSHKASHGPKADSHWHWWTRWQIRILAQIYLQSHTVLKLSPPSAPFTLSFTSNTENLPRCMLTLLQWRGCRGCHLPITVYVHAWGCAAAFISLCWYSTALYPMCQKQQRDNDILYRRLYLDCTGALQREGRRGVGGWRENGKGGEKGNIYLIMHFIRVLNV